MRLSIAIILAGLVTVSAAHAKKPAKQTVCENWLQYKPVVDVKDPAVMVICWDNEDKPYLMHDVKWLDSKDADGNRVRWAVGSK